MEIHTNWRSYGWGIGLLFLLVTACSQKEEVYYEFRSFPKSQWDQREAIRFEVPIKDNSTLYNVFIETRNNNDYPFKNIWLFVDYQTPDGKVYLDTIQRDLADDYGKWNGDGISLYSYSILYKGNVQYPDTGMYVYTIRQGMRTNPLKGISDIGLKISKKTAY
ncbi:MAG: gliding motility lipoprotein GldH [Candidatus Symbiothrix sp.]|jgi:gliding motility-associated lipoprotein GldH|nr:gliding motility lipoprotein GldH [Candidatus Symbiothrix sp.]